MPVVYLTSLLPPDAGSVPRVGRRVSWPGDAREWVWDGERWIPTGDGEFDGGDLWEGESPSDAA